MRTATVRPFKPQCLATGCMKRGTTEVITRHGDVSGVFCWTHAKRRLTEHLRFDALCDARRGAARRNGV